MAKHGNAWPADLERGDFTAREFAEFEKYVVECEKRERAVADALRGAVANG